MLIDCGSAYFPISIKSDIWIVFEKSLQQQCRGAYSAPKRLDYGPGRGKPAPTLPSHFIFKGHGDTTPGGAKEQMCA